MQNMKRALLATALLCAAVTVAHAADPQLACARDAIRFCGATKADYHANPLRKLAIGFCLLAHRSQLSKGCDAVLKSYGH